MEKHKRIGRDIFVSILPWSNGMFVVQASFGNKKNFVRGKSKPIPYEKAFTIFKGIRKRTETGAFLLKYGSKTLE